MNLRTANNRIELAFNVLAMVAMVKQVFGFGDKKENKQNEHRTQECDKGM